MLHDAALQPDEKRRQTMADTRENLTSAGPTLSRTERVSVISSARAAWAGTLGNGSRTLLEDVAYWIAR